MAQGQTLAQRVRAKYPGVYDDLSDTQLEGKVKAKYPGVYDDVPTTPEQAQAERTWGDTAKDFAIGVMKAPAAIVETGGNLIRKIPGVQALEDATGAYIDTGINTAPTNAAQSVGRFVGDVGTAFVPAGQITGLAKGAASLVPAMRGAGLLRAGARAGVEAAGAGSIAAAQGYDPTVPAVLGGALSTVGSAARGVKGALRNPNPVEREALEYVAGKGVPVDAGTMSGNAALKGARHLSDRSIGGSLVATKAAGKEAEALSTIGDELAAKAHPTAATPETAGQAVTSAVEDAIRARHGEANQAYTAFRQIEAQSGGMPVDMTGVKSALKPVYDRMLRQMPVAQQQASKGLKALQNIIESPDVVPASVADADLSAIKSIARGAEMAELRDVSQGVAAKVVGELDAAVQAAAARGGPQASAALQAGRKATRAKYAAADVLDTLSAEPVKAYRQATTTGDAAIDQLRELQKLAPNEMPKVARAYLDDLFTGARSEGGWKGAATMANKWASLGPQTKAILFKNPQLTQELDKFFLAAKKLGENPNPSGTGFMVGIGAQGGVLVTNPVTGAATVLGGAALSKALRSPRIVKLLTAGLSAKPQSLTNKVLWASLVPLTAQENE